MTEIARPPASTPALVPVPAPASTVARVPAGRRVLLVACVIYAALSAWMAVRSHGFLEADGITHYLTRRFALQQPVHFVGVWSRPLCIILYCVPSALGGLIGTRLTSLALVLLTVPLTIASARRVGLRFPIWAGLFLLTQPLLFMHSFSELTEVPFALLLAAAFYAYQRRWFWAVAGLIAVSPLGRPEGFGLIAVAAAALVLHRKWLCLPVLPMGVIAWCWAGWHVYGGPKDYAWWQWLARNWPYSPDSVYGHGSFFWFTGILPAVVGPVAFGFAVFGVAALLRQGRRRVGVLDGLFTDHVARCRLIVVVLPLGVLVAHSLLWMTGKMASNGEPRYLLIVAPFWAMLSAAGLESIAVRSGWRRPLVWVLVNALLAVTANALYPVLPLGIQDDDRLASQVTAWLGQHAELRERYPRLFAWAPHIFLQLDLDKENAKVAGQPTKAEARLAPPGTLLVWDSLYSAYNSSTDYCVTEQLLVESGWVPVATFKQGEGKISRVYLSPLDASGRVSNPNELN